MSLPLISRGFGFPILILWLTLSGCAGWVATDVRPIEIEPPVLEGSQVGWFSVRIQWQWAPQTSPAWHLDLFAAHQLFLPAINAYDNEILLWRVHRRAARDHAGHQFSFIFFASLQTARAIYEDIGADPLLAELSAAGFMRQHQMDLPTPGRMSDLAAASDSNWSPAVQSSWPQYIDGVSSMWLNLVSHTANQMLAEAVPVTVSETAELYRQVQAQITAIWQKEGRHAFLHHLNAIFSYEPVLIEGERWMRF